VNIGMTALIGAYTLVACGRCWCKNVFSVGHVATMGDLTGAIDQQH
jgi:hypothetical protein